MVTMTLMGPVNCSNNTLANVRILLVWDIKEGDKMYMKIQARRHLVKFKKIVKYHMKNTLTMQRRIMPILSAFYPY